MSESPVDVAVQGISLGNAIIGGGVWTAVLTLIGIMWKSRVPMRKLKIEADEALLSTTIARLDKLETELKDQRDNYEIKLDQERTQHAADLSIMRHKMNNLDQCLTMLLMLIEQDPEKAREAAARVRTMRERQEANEAAEKGAMHGAKLGVTGEGGQS